MVRPHLLRARLFVFRTMLNLSYQPRHCEEGLWSDVAISFRYILSVLFFCLSTTCAFSQQWAIDKCDHFQFRHKGQEREFFVYKPEGIGEDAPVVVYCHGYGGGNYDKVQYFLAEADRTKEFVVCVARGLKDPRGSVSWNVGYPFQEGYKVDDVSYLSVIPRLMHRHFGTSRRNVFMVGKSNGGEMGYLMAMKAPKVFRAIVSTPGQTFDNMPLGKYHHPVPFMEIHGTKDVWYGDPQNEEGWGRALSIPAALSYLISVNGCMYMEEEQLPVVKNVPTLFKFTGGKPQYKGAPSSEVWLLTLEKGGHTLLGIDDFSAVEQAWNFCRKYVK